MITYNRVKPMKDRARSFTHSIMENGRMIHYHFEPVFMIDRVKYLVTVLDGVQKLCVFNMDKYYEGWKIINAPKVSDEILKQQEVLAKVIETEGFGTRDLW